MNYSSVEAKVVRDLDDAPITKVKYIDRRIRPDVGAFKYTYSDGFWTCEDVTVRGCRVLDGLDKYGQVRLGKTDHRTRWTSYKATGLVMADVPDWVWTLIERYRPQGVVTVPGA